MKSKFVPDETGSTAPMISLSKGETNRTEIRVLTSAEIAERLKPAHKVVFRKSATLVEQLADRIVLNKSSRTVDKPGLRRHWLLRCERRWYCSGLSRYIEPGEFIQTMDEPDMINLTTPIGSRGTDKNGKLLDYEADSVPYCSVIEEVQQ